MPALPILPPDNPLTLPDASTTPVIWTDPRDWSLYWVLLTVGVIITFEIILALAWLRIHNLRSKARWRRLRNRGIVIVSGSALVYVDDLPRRHGVSRYDIQEKRERVLPSFAE